MISALSGPSHRVAPLRLVFGSSGINTSATPEFRQSSFIRGSKTSGSSRVRNRISCNAFLNVFLSNGDVLIFSASISPIRSHADTDSFELVKVGDFLYETAMRLNWAFHASTLATPKKSRSSSTVPARVCRLRIKPLFASSVRGNFFAHSFLFSSIRRSAILATCNR